MGGFPVWTLLYCCGVALVVSAEMERGMSFYPLRRDAALDEAEYPATKITSLRLSGNFACATACVETTHPFRCVSYNLQGAGSDWQCDLYWKITYDTQDQGLTPSPGVTYYVRAPPGYKYVGCRPWSSQTTAVVVWNAPSDEQTDACAAQIWALGSALDGFVLMNKDGKVRCLMAQGITAVALAESLPPLNPTCAETDGSEVAFYAFT